MIPHQLIDAARSRSEAAVTADLQNGRYPKTRDLLLLHILKRAPTLAERIKNAAFPFFVVVIGLSVMLVATFQHPPVTSVKGRLSTTAFTLSIQDVHLPSELSFRGDIIPVSLILFGYTKAESDTCASHLEGDALPVLAQRAELSLAPSTVLTGRIDPAARPDPKSEKHISLQFETDASSVLQLFQLTNPQPPDSRLSACAETNAIRLRSSSITDIEIVLNPVPVSTLPSILTLPLLTASSATFIRPNASGPGNQCALLKAEFDIIQQVPILGLKKKIRQILAPGTCMTLGNADWRIETSTSAGTFEFAFQSVAGNLPGVDDGQGDTALLSTYLEVITKHPTIGGIFGAIVFILTTLWGVAAFLRELWK